MIILIIIFIYSGRISPGIECYSGRRKVLKAHMRKMSNVEYSFCFKSFSLISPTYKRLVRNHARMKEIALICRIPPNSKGLATLLLNILLTLQVIFCLSFRGTTHCVQQTVLETFV